MAFASAVCLLLVVIDPASALRRVSPGHNSTTSSFVEAEWGSGLGDALKLDAPLTKFVIVTELNYNYMKAGIFQNWLYHATPYLNKTMSLVFDCPDKEAQRALKNIKLPVDAYFLDENYKFSKVTDSLDMSRVSTGEEGPGNDPVTWGSKKYKALMIRRPKAIYTLLQKDVSVLLIDLDTVWAKDPFVQLHKGGLHRDLLVTSDGGPICGCFLWFNPSPNGLDIAKRWTQMCEEDQKNPGNQQALNTLLRKKEREKMGWDMGMLPQDQFPPGKRAGPHATVFHANYMVGTDTKVKWFKRHHLWHAPSDSTVSFSKLGKEETGAVFKEDEAADAEITWKDEEDNEIDEK